MLKLAVASKLAASSEADKKVRSWVEQPAGAAALGAGLGVNAAILARETRELGHDFIDRWQKKALQAAGPKPGLPARAFDPAGKKILSRAASAHKWLGRLTAPVLTAAIMATALGGAAYRSQKRERET